MAQATRDKQDIDSAAQAGELDAAVNAIIDQVEPDDPSQDGSLDLAPGAQIPDNARAEEQPANSDGESDEDLLQAVQALLAEVPPAERRAPAASDTPAQLELPSDLLELPKTSAEAPASAKQSESPDPQAAARIETLDQELAGLADQLISDEISQEPEPVADEAPTLDAAVAASAPAPPKPEPAPQQSPAPEPKKEPLIAAPASAPAAVEVKTGPSLLDRASYPVLVACDFLSRPLNSKPQHVRDKLGWHAMWLAFLGVCVWVFILFFRSPEAPTPSLLPAKAESKEHAPSKAAKKDDHGKSQASAKKGAGKKADKAAGGH